MNRIAFIGEGIFIYWSPIILSLAAIAAIAFYIALYIRRVGNYIAMWLSIPLSIFFSIPLARLVHWYCQSGAYSSFISAMTDYSSGGFALLGVFAGCILSALVLRLLHISRNLPRMLDCMSIGGGIGIAIGRLSSLFNYSDLGKIVPESLDFPLAYGVINAVSGVVDNRLATFMIQSVVTGLIVIILLVYMAVNTVKKRKIADGDLALLFLLAYGASQIVCDSTRYDHLVLRSNGFVSMVQVFGLIAMLIPIVIFFIRCIKHSDKKLTSVLLLVGVLAGFGGAGYMEYFVQNNQPKALFAYTMMAACLIVSITLTVLMRHLAIVKSRNTVTHP